MSSPSNTPNFNLNALPEDVIDEILGGEVFVVDEDNTPEISQITKEFFDPPKTIWCNGCFDVIHAGHIDMLKYARSLGQRLVVGIDTDYRVRESKGITRPINNFFLRKKVLESIRYVDEVVSFGTDQQLFDAIKASGADTIVVGQEYEGRVKGSELVENVVLFPRLYDLSTTKIVNQ